MLANEIRANLAHLSRELSELLADYQEANRAKAKADQAHKVAFARAYLDAGGNMEERKQTAILATSDEAYAAEIAQVEFDNLRAALRVLGQRLDAGRTIASAVRAEGIASGVTG